MCWRRVIKVSPPPWERKSSCVCQFSKLYTVWLLQCLCSFRTKREARELNSHRCYWTHGLSFGSNMGLSIPGILFFYQSALLSLTCDIVHIKAIIFSGWCGCTLPPSCTNQTTLPWLSFCCQSSALIPKYLWPSQQGNPSLDPTGTWVNNLKHGRKHQSGWGIPSLKIRLFTFWFNL